MLTSSMSSPPTTSSASSTTASKSSLSTSPIPRVFDIDHHLNPFIPRPRLHLLPRPLAHILGHRLPRQYPPLPTSICTLLAFLGTFTGLALTTAVFHLIPSFSASANPANPLIIASLGATAILLYTTPQSPLAQPRPLLLGQGISAIVGILITMAFRTLGDEEFARLHWLAGALAVAISAALMGVTKAVHPPAGATALLAVTSPDISELGWGLLALIELGCVIMLIVALVWGNVHVGRRFPHFWWTEMDLGKGEEDAVEMEEEGRGSDERVLVLPSGFVLSEDERAIIARLEGRIVANEAARGVAPEIRGVVPEVRRVLPDVRRIAPEVMEVVSDVREVSLSRWRTG